MTMICTSCGVPVPSSLTIYKCRQCVNHFVCSSCETKPHNQASTSFHTLDKMLVPHVQPTTATASSASSRFAHDLRQNQTEVSLIKVTINISFYASYVYHQLQTSSGSSSIFNSEEYLYGLLAYCGLCDRVVTVDKEPSFQCQQCPNSFGVCAQCMPLVATRHPSVHTFSTKPLSDWTNIAHNLYHLDITCDGCSLEGFNGKRYQCEECPPSYDLCENCFGKKHTHHKLKYIQNPLLHSSNQQTLGLRTLALFKTNGAGNTDWRDPLTGWTKSDAELIIKQGKVE